MPRRIWEPHSGARSARWQRRLYDRVVVAGLSLLALIGLSYLVALAFTIGHFVRKYW